jgi:transcriptional regulator GlxA family with amidase domain
MLAQLNHREGTIQRREAILRDALDSILRDHGPDTDLEAVARRIGTSRRQLQRVFAELSDRNFRDTIAAVRMAHARKLLAGSDRPIAEIGRAAGYQQPAQFSKAFRHHHGTSPRGYRQRAKSVSVSFSGGAGRKFTPEHAA